MSEVPIYLNENMEIEERVSDLLGRLTLKEKFKLLTSQGRLRIYTLPPIERLAIPSFKTSDGPLGVAMHSSGFKKNTRFPATISLAATWNRVLAREVGVAMGEEMRAVGRHVLLAPGINIARTPLNGRTFEYFSEDPFLTKELAVPLVNGIQSMRVAACLKHFAANNQEIDRRSMSSEVDERTLHEIYLRAFRSAVMEAHPWSIMTAYNMVNGVYACENKHLLRDTLIDTWGFDGLVMTDWFASRGNKITEDCINAGLSLEMPWPSTYKMGALEKAYKEGKFTDETLDDLVRRNLRCMLRTGFFDSLDRLPQGSRNTLEHHDLVRRAATNGMVLLKNNNNTLPLDVSTLKRISLHGRNMKKKFGGLLKGGSSAVKPPYEITPLEGITKKCLGKVDLVIRGTSADVAIIFAGQNHSRGGDSEFMDRSSLHLNKDQVEEIKKVANDHQRTVVCLIAGSPIAMDEWIDDVDAVLMCWYGGMEAGNAITDVLFGDADPSGRLPLTFPRKLEDSPAHNKGSPRNYPGNEEKKVFYEEGVFVGYRWFDEKNIEPLFPFGFGLSYSKFDIGHVKLEQDTLHGPEDTLRVEVDVANIGDRAGSEVIQIYVQDVESSVERPPKELVGFEKVWLKPNEKKTVSVLIKTEDLSFYDITTHDWKIENGKFNLLVGRSSRNILEEAQFSYQQ